MDDHAQIYFLENKEDIRFEVKQVIDFSVHKTNQEASGLLENDWSKVHITERALTMNGITYNLNSPLKFPISIPELYFGETVQSKDDKEIMEDMFGEDSSDDEDLDHKAKEWLIQSAEGMAMTTNMIIQC